MLLFLGGACALIAGSVSAQGVATVSGTITSVRCDSVRVGEAAGTVTDQGSFSVRVALDEASYQTLTCGWRLPLFLAPGDSLQVAVASSGDVTYGGRGSLPNDYLARTGGLVGRPFTRTLLPLARKPYDTFSAAWDSLRVADEAALDELLVLADVASSFE